MNGPRGASLFRALGRHPASHVFFAWGVAQLSLLVSGPLVVRLLGVEQRGEMAMIFAVLLLCCQFGLVGMPAAIMYFTASDRVSAWSVVRILRRPLALHLLVAAVVGAGAVLLMDTLGSGLSYPVSEAALVGVGVIATMLALAAQGGLQGEHRFRALALVTPLPGLLYAGALALLLALDVRVLPVAMAALLLGWASAGAVSMLLLRRTRVTAPPSGREAREVLGFGRHAAFSTAAPTDQMNVDQLLIGAVLGHAPLGLYVIGAAFGSVVLLPLVSLGTLAGPRVASSAREDTRRIVTQWVTIAGLVAATICGTVLVVAPVVVPAAFGEAAVGAVPAARLLAVAGLLLGMRRLIAVLLQALGAPGRSAVIEALSFITLAAAVPVLARTHGLEGACVGVIVAGAVAVAAQGVTLFALLREADPTAEVLEQSSVDSL